MMLHLKNQYTSYSTSTESSRSWRVLQGIVSSVSEGTIKAYGFNRSAIGIGMEVVIELSRKSGSQPFVHGVVLNSENQGRIGIISFFFRLVSLDFRLAANLMAGHILLGLLASAYCGILMLLSNSIIIMCIFTLIVCVLLLFELFVSFLQTYVFIVLLCSYYNYIFAHFDARS